MKLITCFPVALFFAGLTVFAHEKAYAACAGRNSCGTETRFQNGSRQASPPNRSSGNAARNQAIIGGVAGIISGMISGSADTETMTGDANKSLPPIKNPFESLPDKSYEERRKDLFDQGRKDGQKQIDRAARENRNNPFGRTEASARASKDTKTTGSGRAPYADDSCVDFKPSGSGDRKSVV